MLMLPMVRKRAHVLCVAQGLIALLIGWGVVCPASTPAQPAIKAALPPEQRPLAQVAPYRRLLWVSRWDYRKPEDVERIFYRAAQARFSDVMFQVRGEGTAFYKSSLEPWAWELSGRGIAGAGTDPGWDPLAKALMEGHRYGLKVHAYLNVMPGWAQREVAPAASGQLFSIHRSWFMMDVDGERMDPRRLKEGPTYAYLDPALPRVREHLAAVAREVAARYPVDGIHLDYIRYPCEHGEYSFNPEVVQRFRDLYGGSPRRRPRDWAKFRRDQVTEVVRAISRAVRQARPGVELSAAIIADPEKRRNDACQDAERWLKEGLLDAVAPMAYTGEMERFDEFCKVYRGEPWDGKVWLGIWADSGRNGQLLGEVRRAVKVGFPGVAVFSYNELFPAHSLPRRAINLYRIFIGESS